LPKPEEIARECIDAALQAFGCCVQDYPALNLAAGQVVAIRKFPLAKGYGFADYMLFADARSVSLIEAKDRVISCSVACCVLPASVDPETRI
jgi:type I restriction enzyme R subunit